MNGRERAVFTSRDALSLIGKATGVEGYRRERNRGSGRVRSAVMGTIQAVAPVNYETSPPNMDDTVLTVEQSEDRYTEVFSLLALSFANSIAASEGDYRAITLFVAAKGAYNIAANVNYGRNNRRR